MVNISAWNNPCKNIYATKDDTYHNLHGINKNKDTTIVKDGKDSCIVMMKIDYATKLDTIINDGIMKDTYIETTDNFLKELSRFQDFLHFRNFYNYERSTSTSLYNS